MGEKCHSFPRQDNGRFSFSVNGPGFYTFRVSARESPEKQILTIGYIDVDPDPTEEFGFVEENTKFDGKIFEIDYRTNKKSMYALYIYCDGKIIEKLPWQKSGKFFWEPRAAGSYKFTIFARRPVGEKIAAYSKQIDVSN